MCFIIFDINSRRGGKQGESLQDGVLKILSLQNEQPTSQHSLAGKFVLKILHNNSLWEAEQKFEDPATTRGQSTSTKYIIHASKSDESTNIEKHAIR